MADFKDAGDALVTLLAGIAYPSGTSQPSITGVPVSVFQGWPNPQQLDADMAAGKAQISVWPTPNEIVAAGVLSLDWQEPLTITPGLSVVVSGQTVTLSGAASTPQNVALIVDNVPYSYAVQAGDTISSIAASLASLAGASSVGAVITLPGTARHIAARSGTTGTITRETRRAERLFQIIIWANAPDKRDPLASAIDAALSTTFRLTLPDGSYGQLRYRSSVQNDSYQKQAVYRRDLMYAVEYATTQSVTATQITSEQTNFSAQIDGATAPISTITINQ
jgi:hypothetical protein